MTEYNEYTKVRHYENIIRDIIYKNKLIIDDDTPSTMAVYFAHGFHCGSFIQRLVDGRTYSKETLLSYAHELLHPYIDHYIELKRLITMEFKIKPS